MSDFPERAYLRQFLVEHFNLAELQDLAFDLSVDYEDLLHSTKSEFCRELIAFFERKGNLSCLLIEVIKRRDDTTINQLLAHFQTCSPRHKVQIILPGDKLVNKPDLLGALAQLLGVQIDDVQLIATASGSIKLLIGLPGHVADWLFDSNVEAFLTEVGYQVLSANRFGDLPATEQFAWKQAALRNWSAPANYQAFGLTKAIPKRRRAGLFFVSGMLTTVVLVVIAGVVGIATGVISTKGNFTVTPASTTVVVATSTAPITTQTSLTIITTLPIAATTTIAPVTTTLTPTPTPTPTPPPLLISFSKPASSSVLESDVLVEFKMQGGPVDHISLTANLPNDPAHNVTQNLAVLKSDSNWRYVWLTTKILPQNNISLSAQACPTNNDKDPNCVKVGAGPTGLSIVPKLVVSNLNFHSFHLAVPISGAADHVNVSLVDANGKRFGLNLTDPKDPLPTPSYNCSENFCLPPSIQYRKLDYLSGRSKSKWEANAEADNAVPDGNYTLEAQVCWSTSNTANCQTMAGVPLVLTTLPGPR